jgi:hypothetical protein
LEEARPLFGAAFFAIGFRSFSAIFARLSAQKASVEQEHMALLTERYDLSNRPAAGVTMDRTKPVQEGIRVKPVAGTTWESLATMTPEQIRERNLFPPGFLPLPHPSEAIVRRKSTIRC